MILFSFRATLNQEEQNSDNAYVCLVNDQAGRVMKKEKLMSVVEPELRCIDRWPPIIIVWSCSAARRISTIRLTKAE